MSEVKRFDHVNHAHIDDCEHVESSEGAWVTASDYDALAAKLTMAEDAAAKGDAARQQCGGMEMEIEELRAELAELRARVVVVPERKLLNAGVPGLNRNSGWNACLDELARINGMTVSEGLLRRLCEPLLSHADYVVARNKLRALLSEQEGGKQ
ncbi:TPA: hypothetical protein N0H42_000451 [Pseudomonas aeruginosa]|uniref:hypothetical protein n=1 Tax=Pseudomonas aeruginosa TaxID=287 RepID=UPI000B4C76B6|nr:hypothetical protein [Pseudomonas aeruginosa]MBH4082458.1 hypothetical protein [Pseudomonas aeruginosa]MCV4168538.1 hypothetical protein [Pseudomonas aeruginosa]OWO85251.1 hypothetical protein B5C27_25675 [Pseudomonas aeruginosa]RQC66304.1 hypothetical protein IPC364_02730 [Pseudomonas aeruginosa]HBP1657370.1 hypothetical protein [Pseudomonas aeruginosa]